MPDGGMGAGRLWSILTAEVSIGSCREAPKNLQVRVRGLSPLRTRQNSYPHRTDKRGIMPLMKPRSLSSFVAGFKTITAKCINIHSNAPSTSVWQRNYYDHIIRHETALHNRPYRKLSL
ncbi:MAG: hypothetical protein AAFW84_01240 [Cyanobacteria bacterium J06635_15]